MMECFSLGRNGFIAVTVGNTARKTGLGSGQLRNNGLEPKQLQGPLPYILEAKGTTPTPNSSQRPEGNADETK